MTVCVTFPNISLIRLFAVLEQLIHGRPLSPSWPCEWNWCVSVLACGFYAAIVSHFYWHAHMHASLTLNIHELPLPSLLHVGKHMHTKANTAIAVWHKQSQCHANKTSYSPAVLNPKPHGHRTEVLRKSALIVTWSKTRRIGKIAKAAKTMVNMTGKLPL